MPGIKIGDKTHHQLQSMYFVNFKVMNTIVSSPANPIPPDDVEFLLIITSFYILLRALIYCL